MSFIFLRRCEVRRPRYRYVPRLVNYERAPDAVRAGIAYLSEDRQGSGILTEHSLLKNVSLVSLPRYLRFGGLIAGRKERAAAGEYVRQCSIRAPSIDAQLEYLSGGNQQKVSLAKTLDPGPRVVIVDEPTRGVDVAAKQEIYLFLAELAAKGAAVLLISSELEEIIGMCDRVVVMREGRVAGELPASALGEHEIMYLATGLEKTSAT